MGVGKYHEWIEVKHLADADMYAEKRIYYVENGIDRRK